MSTEEKPVRDAYLTPVEMRQWAHEEIQQAAKALELRARELMNLVATYAAGEISPDKADELHSRYYHRWAEALPGITLTPRSTDEQILTAMDASAERVRGPFLSPLEQQGRHAERVKGDSRSPERHRG